MICYMSSLLAVPCNILTRGKKQAKTFRPWTNKKKKNKKNQWIICDVTPPTFSSPALGPAALAAAPLERLAFKLWVSQRRVHERSLVSLQGTAGCCHEEGTERLQLSDWPNVPVREEKHFFFLPLWCFCLNCLTLRHDKSNFFVVNKNLPGQSAEVSGVSLDYLLRDALMQI